ncbi:MAG: zinc ribbon domain-containing protein [Thermoplasmata archaeon]|nr:zinc ribbon domain-containing protein [Thermoplasmata archaeon]MBE6523897.1 zinc ribbon domain-containing protein [Thermoplasmata archaeon]
MAFCGRCGTKNSDEDLFCRQCGYSLKDEDESSSDYTRDYSTHHYESPRSDDINNSYQRENPLGAQQDKEHQFYDAVKERMSTGSYSTKDSRGDTIIVSKVTKEDLDRKRYMSYLFLAIGLIAMAYVGFIHKFHIYISGDGKSIDITEATLYELISKGVTGLGDVIPNELLLIMFFGSFLLVLCGFAHYVPSALGSLVFFFMGMLMTVMTYPINLYIVEVAPKIALIDPETGPMSLLIYFLFFLVPAIIISISVELLSKASKPIRNVV